MTEWRIWRNVRAIASFQNFLLSSDLLNAIAVVSNKCSWQWVGFKPSNPTTCSLATRNFHTWKNKISFPSHNGMEPSPFNMRLDLLVQQVILWKEGNWEVAWSPSPSTWLSHEHVWPSFTSSTVLRRYQGSIFGKHKGNIKTVSWYRQIHTIHQTKIYRFCLTTSLKFLVV
jgi:hypothetical protein